MTTESSYAFTIFVTYRQKVRPIHNVPGDWFDLRDYKNSEEFREAAREYLIDEQYIQDPKIIYDESEMPQIFQDVFIDEAGNIDSKLWDIMALGDEEITLIDAYLNAVGDYDVSSDGIWQLLDRAQGAFSGYADTLWEYAYDFLEDTQALENVPDFVIKAIDFEAVGITLTQNLVEYNGYYFTYN